MNDKSLIKPNKKAAVVRQFRCYRGGMISEREIIVLRGNVGEVIQNLGFFSSSLNRKEAEAYMDNTLYEI